MISMAKLDLKKTLNAIDRKNRKFYDNITDEERKGFAPVVLQRYASSVQGQPDLQEWYLAATNEYVNKHFWELTKHPKLQWLLLTTTSPGMGDHFHNWISNKKGTTDKQLKILEQFFPEAGVDELKTLNHIYSKADIKEIAKERGWDDKRIKSEL